MKKEQLQMFYEAHKRYSECNRLFLSFVEDGTMTKKYLRLLIEKRPEVWKRFEHWLESYHLKEE